ncbi:hypothetical protein ICHIJ1_10870 [Fluviibacter phosphoraccumulans]|uniref:Uncharacterized protein n=1 Tax=Fluviibacter phosphoraccumulans TaxID=1751046 RepID=A0A7R6R802_9RHOO|nr:hypothetical protein ICHIAU1_19320 [Fluviibacter phosphoraccumulans]BBU71168.1 hypothetical protein ICHIJ1_10870 [Fluviibacter phosphoraccumulans]
MSDTSSREHFEKTYIVRARLVMECERRERRDVLLFVMREYGGYSVQTKITDV